MHQSAPCGGGDEIKFRLNCSSLSQRRKGKGGAFQQRKRETFSTSNIREGKGKKGKKSYEEARCGVLDATAIN